MKPISWFRMRARSGSESPCTRLPLRRYVPSAGVSRRPRMDSSVDFPQPEGPAIETYSPFWMSRKMPDSAWVSISSVRKTFVIFSSLISGSAMVLVEFDSVICVPLGHVGKNDAVAGLEALDDLDCADGASAELDLGAEGPGAVRRQLEDADRAVLVPECGPANKDHVVQVLQFDRAVDRQIRPGSLGQRPGEGHVDGDRAVRHRRIDPRNQSGDDAVMGVDLDRKSV